MAGDGPHRTFHAIVSGRVQGVGFRAFVHRKANAWNLKGLVRNLPDGSVGVLALGEEPDLQALLRELKRGPMFASVKEVAVRWDAQVEPFEGFRIER